MHEALRAMEDCLAKLSAIGATENGGLTRLLFRPAGSKPRIV